MFSGYDPASIASIADILRRASRNGTIDTAALEEALVDLIHATGIGREDTDAAAWWHDGKRDSHKEIARQFARMADAPDPLDPSLCTAALSPELNGLIINRWTVRWRRQKRDISPSLRNITWDILSAQEQAEIREMARRLSASHAAPANRPRKGDIDSVLLVLAEFYTDQTGYAGHHRDLPHSPGSLFILFVREALRPFFAPSEISAVALARRWQRLKRQGLAESPEPERA